MAPSSVQYNTLFDATYGDKASGGAATLVTAHLRDGDDEDGQTGRDVEVFGQAPVLFVPDDPTDAGQCQGLTMLVGGQPLCIATRDTRAVGAMPALAKGDAAFVCPTGRVGLLAKKDGTIGLLQRGEGNNPDSSLLFEPDGALVITTPYGSLVLDADGFRVILPGGEAFGIGSNVMTVSATMINLAGATVALGAGATQSLTTLSGGVVPIPNVFFRPGG